MENLKKIRVFYGGKRTEIPAKKVPFFGKISGLMFHSRETENLLFDYDKKTKMSIHSFFVFFPFLAVWLDDKNKIIEKRIIKPFTFSAKPRRNYTKLLEIPINNKNRGILSFLVGKKSMKTLCSSHAVGKRKI